ncbi:DUF3972 domain-containing protein [Helicobacter mesocricetorum]|uniref:DUF3972 domain-containing protein n=1 Tax=Helicobacter mesocricetorum TaxID=87012 RepID=UPI000CF12196|nr:DUF3972 domain-containing protein [Helicobacter mesocricetorum]
METWIKIDEFVEIAHLSKEKVLEMVAKGELKSRQENGEFLIDANAKALVHTSSNAVMVEQSEGGDIDGDFVQKTIGTILSLHEKVVSSKEETISSVKSENQFLKDALFNTQEVYEDDKKTIAILREQLKAAQEEIEFLKRKYKMMWGKVIQTQAQDAKTEE